MSFFDFIVFITIPIFLSSFADPVFARKPHEINFVSPNLFPEGLTWDSSAEHFIVGSIHQRTIHSISDAAVVDTLLFDSSLPENVSVLGLAVDNARRRLLAVIHSTSPHPVYNALAAYDLSSTNRTRIFLAPLEDLDSTSDRPIANDVTFDSAGNAYVTNSAGNFIWKITIDGYPSIFSRSPAFTFHKVDPESPFSFCGLNGIVYINKGYLLVVQSNTGKMFKVNIEDGSAREVLLNKDLQLPDGIVVRRDGVVLVVSQYALYFIKSDDSWSQGVVFDETSLEEERFSTSVAVGGKERAYVLYGHVNEGIRGDVERESFSIVEIESVKETNEDSVWVFILIGLGLVYFLIWRFQMRQLATNMNKKIA
ncbi:uncharacterized protein LOC124933467 [Impatiens glandulifera]|uniref:uncharacterized protein LOC124933467 n=1 Tax=Impatiens glandulifera TaxID=253017 RepID=UPI001FB06F78|nr:uncharacterized protein LOC124933467 [Impatiens glandulifera]